MKAIDGKELGLRNEPRYRMVLVDSNNVCVNNIVLPEGWTGSEGEWQVPEGHKLMPEFRGKYGINPGDTWDGKTRVRKDDV